MSPGNSDVSDGLVEPSVSHVQTLPEGCAQSVILVRLEDLAVLTVREWRR